MYIQYIYIYFHIDIYLNCKLAIFKSPQGRCYLPKSDSPRAAWARSSTSTMAGCYCRPGPSSSYILPWTFRKSHIIQVRFEVSKNGTASRREEPPALQVSSCIGERWIFSDQWHRKFGGLAPSLAEDLGLKHPVLQKEVKTLNTSQQTKMFSWHSRKCEWIMFWRMHLCPLRLFLS